MRAMSKKITFLSAVTILLLVIFLPGFSKIQELKQENRELDKKITITGKENLSLAREKLKLETDKLYIEKVARQKMGITKKGETVYRMLPEE